MADTPATIKLTIGGAGVNEVVDVALGEVGYRSHTIKVDVTNAQSYSLIISGNSTLTPPSGGAIINPTANGVKGSELKDLTWGYAWGSTTAADADMNYYGLNPTGASLTVPAVSGGKASFTRKLNFAAKFPVTAKLGNYTNNSVKLSLIATPQQITKQWKTQTGDNTGVYTTVTTMQGITSGFCKDNNSVKTGYTLTLDDVRDNNEYTIVKLDDGNCWMQQNLRLIAPAGGKVLKPADSNVSSNWTMKETLIGDSATKKVSGWKSDNNKPYSAYLGDKQSGVYYNWTAAVAMDDTSSLLLTASTATVASSVCPRGWGLPGETLGGVKNGTFQYLLLQGGMASSGSAAAGQANRDKIVALPYN